MSPSRNGSCSGSPASRNARALAGSARPRRTRTAARTSLTPSSAPSASTSSRSHGFRSCHDMGSPRYGGLRTELRRGLFAGELEPEQRKRRDQHDHSGRDADDEPRPPAALQRLPADLRPEHDHSGRSAERDDDHGRQHRRPLERDLEHTDHQQDERGCHETRREDRLGAHVSESSLAAILRPWTLRTTTRPVTTSSSSSSASASASTRPTSRSVSAQPRSASASWTTTSSTTRRPRTSSS